MMMKWLHYRGLPKMLASATPDSYQLANAIVSYLDQGLLEYSPLTGDDLTEQITNVIQWMFNRQSDSDVSEL